MVHQRQARNPETRKGRQVRRAERQDELTREEAIEAIAREMCVKLGVSPARTGVWLYGRWQEFAPYAATAYEEHLQSIARDVCRKTMAERK